MLNNFFIGLNAKLVSYVDNMVKGRMQFFKINDMVDLVKDNLIDIVDMGFDAVMGIPRSGVLPASIISLFTGKPLVTLYDLEDGVVSVSGYFKNVKNVLLVDDSVVSGSSFNNCKTMLVNMGFNVLTLSVFVHKNGFKKVDKYLSLTGDRVLYEWAFIKSRRNYLIGFDLDGVLCNDKDLVGVKDVDVYRENLVYAKPFLIPQYRIDYIITNRLECFRNITVDWLKKNNVSYRHLIMWDERWDSRKGRYGINKVNNVKKLKLGLFIESNDNQARMINYHTNIPVLCISSMRLYS
ncbi:MAG: hypothetical protein BV457_05415 [Thermoplasmata archaeon M9B1D]|nr:MAG: hypothetical protein BV457_05415 [Thermoplasmata archaeon M9B1D]PNX50254.1 MAG: hypothetical protein BV456_07265 [Thermoplasmata archaeon M8B2D]